MKKLSINNSTQPCTNVADARMRAAVKIMVNCDESYMTNISFETSIETTMYILACFPLPFPHINEARVSPLKQTI